MTSHLFPPALLASEPGSFARDTMSRRVPGILRQIMTANVIPAAAPALEALYDEMTTGRLRGLEEVAPDRAFWDAAAGPYIGRSWLDAPWFFLETFFYRRVLEATGYFRSGPGSGADPFFVTKSAEWAPAAAPAAVAELLERLPAAAPARFVALLHASLWGNRIDLSLPIAAHLGAHDVRDEHLLVDESGHVWAHLQAAPAAGVAVIADNTGTELAMDLALIDFLLSSRIAGRVVLYLKPQPFFVSDAMPADVDIGLHALDSGAPAAHTLAASIRGFLASGALELATHPFFVSSLFYHQLPTDLHAALACYDLVVLKGDLNYRRLCGDARWPSTTPFSRVAAAIPAPLAALRTFKADLIVGLEPGVAERIAAEDSDWLVNGRRGVIQFHV